MSSTLYTRTLPLLVATSAIFAVFILNRHSLSSLLLRKRKVLSLPETVKILTALVTAMHPVVFETAQTAQRAMILASQKKGRRSRKEDEDARVSILMEGGVGQALQSAQTAVLSSFDVTEAEFEQALSTFATEAAVADLVAKLDAVVENFVAGGLPVCSDVVISEAQTIELLELAMKAKKQQIAPLMNEEAVLDEEKVETMAQVANEVEEAVCKEAGVVLQDFHASIAHYTNSSEKFRTELMKLLYEFQSM